MTQKLASAALALTILAVVFSAQLGGLTVAFGMAGATLNVEQLPPKDIHLHRNDTHRSQAPKSALLRRVGVSLVAG